MKKILLLLFVTILLQANANDTSKLVVYFEFNKFNINNNSKQLIDSFFNKIDTSNFKINIIKIAGHTDQIGSIDYNLTLSKQRAASVFDYLKTFPFLTKIINDIEGFGESLLLVNSISESDKFINRRVEIVFLLNKKESKEIIIEQPFEKVTEKNVKEKKEITKPPKFKDLIKDSSIKVGSKLELPHILFVGGRHVFLKYSYPYLDELFFALYDNPEIDVEIQGHICCAPGTMDAYDFDTKKENLSVERAKAVYNFLIEKGIDKNRLSYKGYGHQFPLTQERTPEEQQRNRRVEIKILKK